MHFDWTINVPALVGILVFIGGGGKFFLMVRDEFTELKRILKDFPLHRHVNGDIIYPKGMAPGSSG